MEQFFSLLIVTDELRRSPAVARYGRLHDVTLDVGVPKTITFTLPIYVQSKRTKDVCVLFNPDLVEVEHAYVTTRTHNVRVYTNVTVTLVGRDIGSTTIGFVTPQRASFEITGARPQYAYQVAQRETADVV